MREDYETERPSTTVGAPQFTNVGTIQKFTVYYMYWKEGNSEYSCHVPVQHVQRYRPEKFPNESFEFKACPVHLKVPEEVNFAKTLRQKRKNPYGTSN